MQLLSFHHLLFQTTVNVFPINHQYEYQYQWSLRDRKKYCTVVTIPLQLCTTISIHKSQDMTIGPDQVFENEVILHLPTDAKNKIPGIELAALSRDIHLNCFCVGNLSTELSL